MENLEKRISVGQKNLTNDVQTCVGKKSYYKEITMLKKKLTKQNVQTVLAQVLSPWLAVGPRKNSRN